MKRCSTCLILKSFNAFNACIAQKDGRQRYCRECQAVYRNKYYISHRSREAAGISAYYQKHSSAIKARRRARYYQHREESIAQCREWQRKNAGHLVIYRQKRNAIVKPWRKLRANNPVKAKEAIRRYQARKRGASVETVSYDAIYERERGICYLCNEYVDRHLTHFDHVIPLSHGGAHRFDNIRPTHARCNLKKGNKMLEKAS